MICLILASIVLGQSPGDAPPQPVETPRVLVFSKTAGFRHGSIEPGIEALQAIGGREFAVEHTEDSSRFNADDLAAYDAVVFLNTTQDVLDDAQQRAFIEWYRDGGGYVGIHAAADTEYAWPWYGQLMGAWFKSHPQVQEADVMIEDST
ncbi:MAG: ThuA domain-containing protein, partial [Planctomycetota bacterium]|nr:ThuA domain-containing protein [Planctomycetota bacterium]